MDLQRAGLAVISIGITTLILILGGCGSGGDADRAAGLADEAAAAIDAMIVDGEQVLVELAGQPALEVVDPEQVGDDGDHDHHADTAAETDEHQREIEQARRQAARRCTAAVSAAAEENPQLRAVGRALTETIGGVDCISAPDRRPLQVGDEIFFLRAYGDESGDRRVAVGDYAFDGDSAEQFLPIGLGIPGGVLFAELELGALWQRLAAIERGEGADIVVTDANGTIIARPALPYWIGRSLAGSDPLIDAMLERDSGTATFEVEDRERLYAFTTPAAARGSVRVAAGVPR